MCIMFNMHAAKYKDQIVMRDEGFFLTHDFKDELESSDNNFSIDILAKLKVYWKGLEIGNKQMIWSYLGLFYKLNDKMNG